MTFKELIDKVRSTSLSEVLRAHDLVGKKEGTSVRYKSDSMNIIVSGDKWYDNKRSLGGVGPIDLTSHLRMCSFREAVIWLDTSFHTKASLFPKNFEATQSTPPAMIKNKSESLSYEEAREKYASRDDSRWKEARSYLVDQRCLNGQMIDALFKSGDIYATKKGGIAFLHRNIEGEEVGSSIRSIQHHSTFRQSIGKKVSGWFALGNLKLAKTVVVVESAIDALSWAILYPLKSKAAVVAISGAYSPLPLLQHALKNGARIIAAYDNDVVGLNAKEQLGIVWRQLSSARGVFSEKTPVQKDWNEDLCQILPAKELQGGKKITHPIKNKPVHNMSIESKKNSASQKEAIEITLGKQCEFAEQLGFLPSKKENVSKKRETLEEKLERLTKEYPDDPEDHDKQVAIVTKEVQLPLWHEDTRAQANSLIRSALFAATNPNAKRDQYKKMKVASVEGIEILYTGEQLNQSDADVLDTVLHICRRTTLGLECRVTGYRLLKLLNKKDSKQNYTILDMQLTRMVATAIRIRVDKRWSYEGSIIQNIRRDEVNGDYLISLNPTIAQLFQEDQYTLINHRLLMALQRNPLAQWAIRYFSSHAEPYPMKFQTIRELSGSKIKELKSFRQTFKKAIEKIDVEHRNLCEKYEDYREHAGIGKWSATTDEKTDLVTITHPKSKSQRRYLESKKNLINYRS